MRQNILVAASLSFACCFCSPLWAQRNAPISDAAAARHGLVRPWFAQVHVDQTRGRLQEFVLYQGTLYVQTDKATIHALDAETGKTLWTQQIGRPDQPSLTPSASHNYLGVINGSHLYIVNRFTGDLLYERQLEGGPGAGPALSAKHAYVPMVSGMLTAYRLEPEQTSRFDAAKAALVVAAEETPKNGADRHQQTRLRQEFIPPLSCKSSGRAVVQPLVMRETAADEFVAWATDKGYLNVSFLNRQEERNLELRYRLTTDAPIAARPAYQPPDPNVSGDSGLILAVSGDGFVYAIKELSGDTLWQFATSEPIVEPPAVVEDHVYVPTQIGGMYCLDIKTGKSLWWAHDVMRFVAASETRVYVSDRLGRLLVFNTRKGSLLDTISTETIPIKLLNTDTDRIYLADSSGLIQCLHEIEQTQPLEHGKQRKQAAAEAEKPAKKAESRRLEEGTFRPQGTEGHESHEGRKEDRRGRPGGRGCPVTRISPDRQSAGVLDHERKNP